MNKARRAVIIKQLHARLPIRGIETHLWAREVHDLERSLRVGAITGHENSGADVTAAQVSLVNVVTAINSLPADATSLPAAVGGVITITPGVYKLDATVIADSLIFSGGPGSTFYIVSSSAITLSSVPSVTLAGGVKEQNIFWLASSGFSTAGSSPPTR